MLTDAAALIGDDFVFQQDNVPIHTSRSTRQWLRQHDVTLLDWPPKSPDANPIEGSMVQYAPPAKWGAYSSSLYDTDSCKIINPPYSRDGQNV